MIIGVDPGLDGAIVRIKPFPLAILTWVDFRPYTDAKALYETLTAAGIFTGVSLIIIERPSARPASQGQGVTSAFNFGHSCGLIFGLCTAAAPQARIIRPQPAIWKAALGVPADKQVCTARAAELFPDSREIFYSPRGGAKDGRAEAALLAYFGVRFLAPQKKVSRLI